LAGVPLAAAPANTAKKTTCTCTSCGTSASTDVATPLGPSGTLHHASCGTGGCSCVKSTPCNEQLPALLPASYQGQQKVVVPSAHANLMNALLVLPGKTAATRDAIHAPPNLRCLSYLPHGDRAPPAV
jgi:hypothetical protein